MGKHDVRGYPTIKYGDPNDLQDYDGGRNFDALKKFADENLGPQCGIDNIDLCDEDTKAVIDNCQKRYKDELELKIEEANAKIKKIEDSSQKVVSKWQSQISDVQKKIEAEN